MGYLVTLTIHMDNINNIESDPKRFVQELRHAALQGTRATIFGQTEVQGRRHASYPAIYVQMGNTCTLMEAYSGETQRFRARNPSFFSEMLDYMEKTVRDLRRESGLTEKTDSHS